MRTLILSDLHLGNRGQRDVLRRPAALAALLDALTDVDRLVLLGDLVELQGRMPRRRLEEAEPILRALGTRLGPGREVVVVPGNHDHPLLRAWCVARGHALGIAEDVPLTASPALTRLAGWLGPATVRVAYPGVWLADDVYATHGHYLDRHLVPDAAIGLPRGRLRRGAWIPGVPAEYERGRLRTGHEGAMRGALSRPLGVAGQLVAHPVRAVLMPSLPHLLAHSGLSRLSVAGLDAQMRHAALPALERVVARLQVSARWVIFGHVHRRGPLPGEAPRRWPAGPTGATVLNSGAWLYEPLLVDRVRPPHPYWPGGAVVLEPGREPRAVGLLDDLGHADLRPPAVRRPDRAR